MNKTFLNFDKFGLVSFADDLTVYLQVESKFVDGSFVLSLNSEFGSGKSTFFEMWADKLRSDDNKFEVVPINAWESDFQGDPLLAIVSHLLNCLKPSDNVKSIKETTEKLCKFAMSVASDVVQKFTGIDGMKAGQYAESKNGIAKPEIGCSCFELYNERHKLFENLKTLLRNLTCEPERSILIIVDELDRCRPNYAIEFLETIKHFFDIKGLIFVIGADKGQLASSAKALFGQQLVFDEYYRKFAHRNVNLPVKSQTMTERFCRELIKEYLSEEAFGKKNRFLYGTNDSSRTEDIESLCTAFALNARQMHELFRITAHVLSLTKKPNDPLLLGWQIGVFFMVALSIEKPAFYERIGKREISLSEFTGLLKPLSLFKNDNHSSSWWAGLLYLGVFSDQPLGKVEQAFGELGVWDPSGKEKGAFQEELSKFNGAFGHIGRDGSPVFSKIYQVLEGLVTFEKK